jgi:2-amino-4-hydroxy-6-hydroxymethyldihydropteridine diphosphokinase
MFQLVAPILFGIPLKLHIGTYKSVDTITYVSLKIESGCRSDIHFCFMAKAFLSLGSNIGDRAAHLDAAIAALSAAGFRVGRVSSFYETEPVDYLKQDWFLNCVVEGETNLPPSSLLSKLREIETRMGSKKMIAKGPRILDIDILLYGDETIASPELQVPHPRMTERRFVLVPLAEIAPELRHPSWQANVQGLLAATRDHSEVRRITASPR